MSPNSARQLAEIMAAKNARAEKVPVVDLRQMNCVLELTPEDMTVTVESGITLGTLQTELAKHGQWLPIDPPNAEKLSIHELLARDSSGPRRFGYGTIREHLIGMKLVLADGRMIKSGGKVVKNVAGYDLAKLFIGARDSLGVIVEATFKVRPLPEVERIVSMQAALADANKILRAVWDSELTSVILDAHRLTGAKAISISLGLAGTSAEVDWQLGIGRTLGFTSNSTLIQNQFWNESGPVARLSVLPSQVVETIAGLDAAPFIARAGNGVIYHRGPALPQKVELPVELMRRVKNAYDPKNIFPEFTR